MDTTQIDINHLEETVTLFYRSGSQMQSAAHEWLTKVQLSTSAWSFVWELMKIEKSSEIQFFGATTLHTKLAKHWKEVPAESRDELRQKLFQSITTYANGPKLVLNRLCISLSAFIVNTIYEHPTAIEEIVNTFHVQKMPNVDDETQTWILLEILSSIPEQTNSNYTSAERTALNGEVSKRSCFVINTVQQYVHNKLDKSLTDDELSTLLRAIKCLEAWLKFGNFPLNDCEVLTGALIRLINKCYWNTSDSDGCMTSDENELSEACIKTITLILVQPDAHRYQNTALRILNLTVESLSQITKAEWKENNLNEDIAFNIYTLFISASECHSKLLVSGVLSESAETSDLYMRIINEILQCTNKPGIYPVEESCSILSMGFWYMLQDEVISHEQVVSAKDKGLQLIGELYSHLAKILIRKAQQPDESSIDKWTADDLETFRCYRQDISDTLLYCYEVLHGHLLEIMVANLSECILNIQRDPTQWAPLEASIYALYSIAEHVQINEKVCVPKFVEVLSSIPYDRLNEKLLDTSLEAVGVYGEWFKENPNYLPNAIHVLAIGLSSTETSQATLGLKDICRECQIHLKPYAEPLLQACLQSINNGRMENSDEVRLMYSIGKLMSMLESDAIFRWLDIFVSPCFAELQTLVQSQALSEPNKARTVFRLNMISTMFSSLNIKVNSDSDSEQKTEPKPDGVQPVIMILQKTMPIFKEVALLWINENKVIEALCGALKYAITNLMDEMLPVLSELCSLIVSILPRTPAIEISKSCIICYIKTPQCHPIMRQLIIEVINHSFRLIEQTPRNDLSGISDVLESFYGFNALIVKKAPEILQDPEIDCDKLLKYATNILILPETSVSKQTVMFLQHFIMNSRNYQNATNALLQNGESLIQNTLLCIAVFTPRTHVELFADIFVALNKKYPAEMADWLKMLDISEFPVPVISIQDKREFKTAIVREKANKRVIQAVVREFSARCRSIIERDLMGPQPIRN